MGLPSLRLKGDYLAIVSLGFGEIVRVLIQALTSDALYDADEIAQIPWYQFPKYIGGSLGFSSLPFYNSLFWSLGLAGLTMLGKGGGLMAIGQLAGGPVSLAIGVTILGVASAFKQVVETKGSDVPHMMAALQKITTAYTIQIVVLVVSFTGGFIAGALGYR